MALEPRRILKIIEGKEETQFNSPVFLRSGTVQSKDQRYSLVDL